MVQPVHFDNTAAEAKMMWQFFESQMLPEEKERIKQQGIEIAKRLRAEGSKTVEGLGQRKAVFPRALVVRLHQMYPGWLEDRAFMDAILEDNPEFCAPGYKPKPNGLRNGLTGGWLGK